MKICMRERTKKNGRRQNSWTLTEYLAATYDGTGLGKLSYLWQRKIGNAVGIRGGIFGWPPNSMDDFLVSVQEQLEERRLTKLTLFVSFIVESNPVAEDKSHSI